MKYYELWLVLMNWKEEFTVREFKRTFASPDPNKVLHDMKSKGFLKNVGWGKYKVVKTGPLYKKRADITSCYALLKEAKMKYAFTEKDAVFIWTGGGYQVDRFSGFYPIHIKVRRKDLKKWKSFFQSRGKMLHISGKPVKETFFGIFYVLYPEKRFKTETAGDFSVIPLKETVDFCKENIFIYEPALEMLNEMYKLGLKVRYKEVVTNM